MLDDHRRSAFAQMGSHHRRILHLRVTTPRLHHLPHRTAAVRVARALFTQRSSSDSLNFEGLPQTSGRPSCTQALLHPAIRSSSQLWGESRHAPAKPRVSAPSGGRDPAPPGVALTLATNPAETRNRVLARRLGIGRSKRRDAHPRWPKPD